MVRLSRSIQAEASGVMRSKVSRVIMHGVWVVFTTSVIVVAVVAFRPKSPMIRAISA